MKKIYPVINKLMSYLLHFKVFIFFLIRVCKDEAKPATEIQAEK